MTARRHAPLVRAIPRPVVVVGHSFFRGQLDLRDDARRPQTRQSA